MRSAIYAVRDDLPGDPETVLQPATRSLLSTSGQRVPVVVDLSLARAHDLLEWRPPGWLVLEDSYGDETCTEYGVDTRVDAYLSFLDTGLSWWMLVAARPYPTVERVVRRIVALSS